MAAVVSGSASCSLGFCDLKFLESNDIRSTSHGSASGRRNKNRRTTSSPTEHVAIPFRPREGIESRLRCRFAQPTRPWSYRRRRRPSLGRALREPLLAERRHSGPYRSVHLLMAAFQQHSANSGKISLKFRQNLETLRQSFARPR